MDDSRNYTFWPADILARPKKMFRTTMVEVTPTAVKQLIRVVNKWNSHFHPYRLSVLRAGCPILALRHHLNNT